MWRRIQKVRLKQFSGVNFFFWGGGRARTAAVNVSAEAVAGDAVSGNPKETIAPAQHFVETFLNFRTMWRALAAGERGDS